MRLLVATALLFCGCICGALDDAYARLADAGRPVTGEDAGSDAGARDAGVPDGGVPDAGAPDGGLPDAGPPDGGPPDAGLPDAGMDGGVCRPNMSPCLDSMSSCCAGSCCASNGTSFICLPDPPDVLFPGFLCTI